MKHTGLPPIRSSLSDQERLFAPALETLKAAIDSRAFPGASFSVTRRATVIGLLSLGHFTFEPDSLAVTPTSIFDLASVSKVIATTTMAMILYDQGVLVLDLAAHKVVPELCGSDSRRERITLRMLLTHSSGFPAYEKLFLKAPTRQRLLNAAFTTPLATEPGSRAEYSDIGFMILAVALERIADQSLNSFCQREVFTRLGMSRTMFNPPNMLHQEIVPTSIDTVLRNRTIQGEVQDENASVLGGVAGHAGVFSTAGDLAIFADCLLQGGSPLVSPTTVSHFTRRELSPPGTSRALGWDTPSPPSQSGRYLSSSSYGHLGYTGTSLWIDPERELSITLLTNRTWPDCSNQAIKQVRPQFYDAVIESLSQ